MNALDSSPGPMNVLFDPNATRLETVPKDFIGDMDPGKIWGSNGQWVRIKPLLCKTILAYIKCLAFSNTIRYI